MTHLKHLPTQIKLKFNPMFQKPGLKTHTVVIVIIKQGKVLTPSFIHLYNKN